MTAKFSAVLSIARSMTQTKQASAARSTKKPCAQCEKPAGFITPLGLLCTDNAMAAMDLIQQTCQRQGAALLCTSHDPALADRFSRKAALSVHESTAP